MSNNKHKINNHRKKVNAYSNKRYVPQVYEHSLAKKFNVKLLKTDCICVCFSSFSSTLYALK